MPLTVEINYRLLAEHLVRVMFDQGLLIPAPVPDVIIDADHVRALLGKRGRMLSYATLKKMIDNKRLTPLPGEDGRRIYFSQKQVNQLLGK